MLRSFEALSTNSVRKCMEITLENLKLDTKRDLKGYERCLVHPVNHLQCCNVAVDGGDNWELKQQRREPHQQLQKTICFLSKTTFCTCITLFSTFLWRPLHDYDVKPPNATFYGGRGYSTTNYPFSFWTWIKSLRTRLQEKSPSCDILRGSK